MVLALLSLTIGGCSTPLQGVSSQFYDYQRLFSTLQSLREDHSSIIEIYSIGKTHEGRDILAIKVSKEVKDLDKKPGILTVFAEHAGEHETTSVAMGMVRYLVDTYPHDKDLANSLEKVELWIIPMMNPDGVEYDLSRAVEPFSWRKNRRRTGSETYGVDLNRNWDYHRETIIPPDLEERLSNKGSEYFAGEQPFSELETQAVRDFLEAHTNIRMFIDYHSGAAEFMQGGVGCSNGRGLRKGIHPEIDAFCDKFIESFATIISDPEDGRPGFLIASRQDAVNIIKKRIPWYLKLFVPSQLPEAPGTAVEYTYDQLEIVSIGVEIFRDKSFLKNLPESQYQLIQNQVRGMLLLLEVLSKDASIQQITRHSS
jgi:hypothetical protein